MAAGDDRLFRRLEEAVRDAGRFVAMEAGRAKPVPGTAPGNENPSTDLDRETDALLHDLLLAAFEGRPEPAWLTEERSDDLSRLKSSEVLIVDPIDGTRNLLRGLPEATISVALWREGRLEWGCVHNPFTHECFTASRGGGAWRDGQPLRVSDQADRAAAGVLLSRHESEKGWFEPLDGKVRWAAVGSVAYKMALTASGRTEGTFTHRSRHEWDVAAGTILIREAGGRVTDSRGRDLAFNGRDLVVHGLVASNARLHDWFLELVRL